MSDKMNQKKILIIISIILVLVSFVLLIKQDKPNINDSFECIVDESDTQFTIDGYVTIEEFVAIWHAVKYIY